MGKQASQIGPVGYLAEWEDAEADSIRACEVVEGSAGPWIGGRVLQECVRQCKDYNIKTRSASKYKSKVTVDSRD